MTAEEQGSDPGICALEAGGGDGQVLAWGEKGALVGFGVGGCGWGGKGARKERIRDNWAAGGR